MFIEKRREGVCSFSGRTICYMCPSKEQMRKMGWLMWKVVICKLNHFFVHFPLLDET